MSEDRKDFFSQLNEALLVCSGLALTYFVAKKLDELETKSKYLEFQLKDEEMKRKRNPSNQ